MHFSSTYICKDQFCAIKPILSISRQDNKLVKSGNICYSLDDLISFDDSYAGIIFRGLPRVNAA